MEGRTWRLSCAAVNSMKLMVLDGPPEAFETWRCEQSRSWSYDTWCLRAWSAQDPCRHPFGFFRSLPRNTRSLLCGCRRCCRPGAASRREAKFVMAETVRHVPHAHNRTGSSALPA